MIRCAISWLKQLVMERDSLAEANRKFIEYHTSIYNEMRMAERFEWFLKRLQCIDKKTELIPLDWDDHMRWYWTSYKQRIKDEQEKANRKTDA